MDINLSNDPFERPIPPHTDLWDELGINKRCTCDEYEWWPHQCPYRTEINNDYDYQCFCCTYCTNQCRMDI